MPNLRHQLLLTTDSWKLVYQLREQPPLIRYQSLPAPYKRLIHDMLKHYKRTEQNDLTF